MENAAGQLQNGINGCIKTANSKKKAPSASGFFFRCTVDKFSTCLRQFCKASDTAQASKPSQSDEVSIFGMQTGIHAFYSRLPTRAVLSHAALTDFNG